MRHKRFIKNHILTQKYYLSLNIKKKSFIELPPKFSYYHYNDICEDIIINFSKGRKILVICDSIKEANCLKKDLDRFDLKDLIKKYKNIDNHYRENIILFTGYDMDKKDYYNLKNKKIILSSYYVWRDINIKTTSEEESNGGLHVILTYMPCNYRLFKKVFGRNFPEGKNGTGQIIIKRDELEPNYSKLFEKM